MSQSLTQQDERANASIDGRVAFGVSTLALAALLLFLLDRVGAPQRLVASLGPLSALCALGVLGLLLRCMRVSAFYAAGRSMPAPWAGFALASLFAALFAPLLPSRADAWSDSDLVLGFLGGVAVAAFVTGPLVRKTGAYSLVDLLSARFPSAILRLGLAAVVCLASLLAAGAGFETATRGLQTALAVDRRSAVLLVGAVILLITLPGGLSGVVWAAFAAACVFLLGSGLPLALAIIADRAAPQTLADASSWSAASRRLAEWSIGAPTGLHPNVVAVCALGVGALAPLMAPAIATRDRRNAHAAGRSSLFWSCALAAIVAATLVASTLTLDGATVGQRPDQLPDVLYGASARGLVTFCGKAAASPAEAAAACGAGSGAPAALRSADVRAQGAFLLTALPALRGQSDAVAGLDAAGAICLALALAAASFQAMATTISNDLVYHLRRAKALASRRLAMTRFLALAAVVGATTGATEWSFDAAAMIALAVTISTATIAPLLLLTFWPRATALDALVALVCGSCVYEIFVGSTAAPIERLATSAGLALVVAVAAGVATSLLRRPDPLRSGRVFFDRVTHGYGDVLNPDGGA